MARNDWQRSIHSAHRWLMRWLPAMANFPPEMANLLPGMANVLPVTVNLPVTGYHQMAKDFQPKHRPYPLS